MISTAELAQKEFTGIKLPDPYGAMLGEIADSASMSIWGPPGSGKSTFALDLACIMADEVGKGIYCSSEEGMGPSLQNRVKRLKAEHENLLVSDFDSMNELKAAIKYSKAKFVILDSISKSNIRLKDFEEFLEWCQHHGVISVFILHTTKTGTYKGPTEYIHDPDIEIKVEDGIAQTGKNRFQETPREMEIQFDKTGKPDRGPKTDDRSNGQQKKQARANPETVSRYKSQYDTEEKAWRSIAGSTDLTPADVQADHTKKKWRWKVETRANSSGSGSPGGVDEAILNGLEYIENPSEELRENRAVKPEEIYSMITDNIIRVIENEGDLPWQKRYDTQYFNQVATNFASQKPYRGINFILLNYFRWIKDGDTKRLVPHRWKNPYFLTFKQVNDRDGKVKEGAVSQRAMFFTLLYSYQQVEPDLEFSTFDRDEMIKWFNDNRSQIDLLNTFTAEELTDQSYYPILKYYNLFNGEDIEGITFGKELDTTRLSDADRIKAAELIWEHYPDKPGLVHKKQQPSYDFTEDVINMPKFGSYEEPQYYYSTLYHEAVHSTGHKKRLKREFGKKYGDNKYAFEELVAEMGAAYLSGEAGILFRTINQSAAYLKGWNERLIKAMEDNNEFFFRAASRSQAAADLILDRNDDGVPAYLKDFEPGKAEQKKTGPKPKADKTKDKPKEIDPYILGKETTVDFKADGSIQEQGHFAVIEVDDIIPSHNKDCTANSKHKISKGQPRDRSLDALCNQPKFIARNLNPTSITRGNLAFNGASSLMPDGQVIQGNGRGIALKIAKDEHPKKYKKYKEYIIKNAGDWGLRKAELKKFNHPALVRILDVTPDMAIELGNVVDTSQAKMSKVDQGKAYIRNLSKQKKQAIGNLISDSGGETLGEVIDDVGLRIMDQIEGLDRQELVEDNGLTSEGKDFLRSVFAGLVFDSDENNRALQHFLNLKHTQKAGLERSYGNIIPFIGTSADLAPVIQKAVEIVAQVQRNEGLNTVDDFMNQADAFTGVNAERFTTEDAQLAKFLLDAGTQKTIRNGFRMYQWKVNGKEDLFNPIEKVSPELAFEDAFVKQERINPVQPLIYIGTTERITIDGGENQFEMKGEFPSFVSNDKLYIVPFTRVRKVAQAVDEPGAIEAFEDWHNYDADEIDYEIDWPEHKKVTPVGTAKKIWYASDKIISNGDAKGKINHYVHDFDKGKRPAVVKGDILIIGNMKWDERGLLN